MIFLKTEKGHEKLIKWEDVSTRPLFIDKLPKGEYKLSHIIGYYEMKKEIHCALSTCNQPHGKGYIVQTQEGFETNIGNHCGKNIFGIEFESHTKEFDKYKENEERKTDILSAKNQINIWRRILENLRFKGKDILWATTKIEQLLNAHHSGRAGAMEMRSLSKTQDPVISIDIKDIDPKLKELLFLFNKKYRESGEALSSEVIGKIKNLHVLITENNMKIRHNTIYENIKAIEACDLTDTPSPVLLDLSQKANLLNTDIKQLTQLFKDAKTFLQQKNLSPVLEKLQRMDSVPESECNKFQEFLNEL
ncbi:hypothetical protein KKI95_15980 [Xenorhabdus bovienii]|uniref:hypothetical protein n=1 Tax=Xenorhabdus bovienii TaxID=40576 RepID=UPI0023B30212|nr:hypothetical protein [Xenorhabdus bovienii]MDE9429088.1 hypothetical protein [Xenorhabdus bovienii]MDE9437386.1 hypothetical protein [Xenorhabdus bovienii]MDE9455332.1 hypothetical protein [Xenorhabdus bovienii]MDE9499265.1 hypothetical protein [Xenorhabdus bovienii]MDE9538856.1 hypothetical protein [Xenorhabdus bovienii]